MKVGVVGTGGMGNVHTKHWKVIPGVEVCAFDSDSEKLAEFCNSHGIRAMDSYEKLLTMVDAVDICLPTHLHLEAALKAIAAKKAVLVEKPMARSLEECRQMINAAKEADVLLSVAHVVRFFPEHRRASELVKSGAIGNPAAIRMRRGGGAPKGSNLWFQDFDKSGGVLLDLAIHEFDWLRWTLGDPRQVYARSVRLGPEVNDAKIEGDYALTTLSFESGALAHVESTWMDPSGFRSTIEASGSGGTLEFDSRMYPTLRVNTAEGSVSQSHMDGADDPYFLQLSAFKKAFDEKSEPAVTGEDGMAAVAIALAAIESAKTLSPVKPLLS